MRTLFFFLFILIGLSARSAQILIPMDDNQKNHLKAYGIAYWVLQNGIEMQWLLNYRGGSFMVQYAREIENECKIRGVSYETIPDGESVRILNEIADPEVNMDAVKLEMALPDRAYTALDCVLPEVLPV